MILLNKNSIIMDYNSNKSGGDKFGQMAKEYRAYRSTRRWPCVVFFDLVSMATHASWVLFCLKYPNDPIVKCKDRKLFLYKLGIELTQDLITIRLKSKQFRYFSIEIKIKSLRFLKMSPIPFFLKLYQITLFNSRLITNLLFQISQEKIDTTN